MCGDWCFVDDIVQADLHSKFTDKDEKVFVYVHSTQRKKISLEKSAHASKETDYFELFQVFLVWRKAKRQRDSCGGC